MIDQSTLPTISETLRNLGATVRGKRATGVCHGGTTPGVIAFDDERGLFFCHRCGIGGDVVRLVETTVGTDFKGAVQWLGLEPGRPPAPDPQAARRKRAQAALDTWATRTGRELREQFRLRSYLETAALQRGRKDPESEIAWNLLEVAYSGLPLDEIEARLDAIDGTPAQRLQAWRELKGTYA